MKIVKKSLNVDEYYAEVFAKDKIFIHHTSGSHRPDWTIDGWEADKIRSGGTLRVATSFVIGGISTIDGNSDFDGVIYQAFNDKYWAHHLGMNQPNNRQMNQHSIAIEICNYGPLTRTLDGKYLNYVNKQIPESMVVELAEPFRGFKYYHKYTDKQLDSLKELLVDLSGKYNINLKEGIARYKTFDYNNLAVSGVPGLWTHTNVRRDKTDCSPQPKLLDMIYSLK